MSDSGYAWVIVAACFFNNFALFGLHRSGGIMYVEFLKEYGLTREEASWPFSLCPAVFQLIGLFGSLFVQFVSLRQVAVLGSIIATSGLIGCFFANSMFWINICYGIVHGVGFGLVILWTPVVINNHFVKYRTTAMGLSFAGGSISSLIFPPFIEFLLKEYGMKGTFLIVAGVVMNTIVTCLLLRPPGPSNHNPSFIKDKPKESLIQDENEYKLINNDETKRSELVLKLRPDAPESENLLEQKSKIVIVPKKSIPETTITKKDHLKSIADSVLVVVRKPVFYLLTLSTLIFFTGVHSYFVIVVDYAKDKGIPESDAVYFMPMFSVTDLIGRIGLGWINDRQYVKRKNMFIVDLLLYGGLTMMYPLVQDFTWFAAISMIQGLAVGNAITLLFVIQVEYFGLKNQVYYCGISQFIGGMTTFVRPPMIGLFRDTIGSYDLMFCFLGSLNATMGLFWIVESCITKKSTHKSNVPC